MVAMALLIQIKEQVLTRPAAVRMNQLIGLQAVHPARHVDTVSARLCMQAQRFHWQDRLTRSSPATFPSKIQQPSRNSQRHPRHRRHLLVSPMMLPEKRALPWKDAS